MRPRQWVKNFVVFAALLFTGLFRHPDAIVSVLAAFALFCLLSSVGYLVNDVLDAVRDREHPLKRRRPIAAGRIRRSTAITVAVLLGISSLLAAWALDPYFAIVALAYLAVTLTYTLFWKREVILDLAAIAGGFLLRALAGTVILGVEISPWLFVCISLLALLLGLGKRRNELLVLADNHEAHRPVLAHYSRNFLDHAMTTVASASLVTYAVYAISSPTAHAHPQLVYTVPLVIYAILRYCYLALHHDQGGQPEEMLLTDRPLVITIGLWAAAIVTIYLLGGRS
jgi:4-hydroxybenzoate polyprenyltransferase